MRAKKLIVVILLFIVLGSIPLALASEREYDEITLDLTKDPDYEKQFSWKNTSIYYANNADYHYFYISSGENISKAYFGNEDTEYNISTEINNMAIQSIRNNDTIELKADQKFGNKLFIEVDGLRYILEVEPVIPVAEEEEEDTEDETKQEEKDRSITLEYLLIAIIIFSNMFWVFAIGVMKARNKTIIGAYSIKEENGKEVLSAEAETIGLVKNENDPDFDTERGLFIYEVSHMNKRFKLFSLLSLQEFKANHRVIKDYWIRSILDAYTHKVKVDQNEIKIGYSLAAKVGRFLTNLLKFSAHGVPLCYSINFVILLMITARDFILSLIISIPLTLFITILLYFVEVNHVFKKKTETVTEELHLSPIKSRFKVLYVYKISGLELQKKNLKDKTKKAEWKRFENRIVEGWDKINEMKRSDLIKIKDEDIIFVRKKRVKLSEHKIEDLRKSYIFRNKHLTELILEQNKEISKKAKKIQELEKEKQLAKEGVRQESAETMIEIDRAQDLKWKGIKQYFIDKFGDAVEKDFAGEMKRLVESQAKSQGKDIKTDIESIKQILTELYHNRNKPNSKLDLTLEKLKQFDKKTKGEKASG